MEERGVLMEGERVPDQRFLAGCEELIDPRQHGFIDETSCTTQTIPSFKYE